MSIQGINFANQRLVPSDDGRLYQKIFNDGALYGCSLNYSGSNLTIAAGHLIIGGRQIELTAAEQFAVNQAVSGYAQIVIGIDLTKTATTGNFNQVSFDVRYATSKEGFATMIQEDINGAGSYYEAQLALLALGPGGITEVVEGMPQAAFRGAEGGGVNLHVVGGTVQPAAPKENTVWVNTAADITGYAFSATAPLEPAEGLVWIVTSTAASAPINIDKKNAVMIYPNSCYQYVSGAWISRTAMTYAEGQWRAWIIYLIIDGADNLDVSGGWTGVGLWIGEGTGARVPDISFEPGKMVISQSEGGGKNAGIAYAKNKQVLTGKSKITANVYSSQTDPRHAKLAVWSDVPDNWEGAANVSVAGSGLKTVELDVSALSGEYYIGFTMYQYNGGTLTVEGDLTIE